jgi:hypothetical protein
VVSPLFAKLNWKRDVPVWVLDAPASFGIELAALAGVPLVTTQPPGPDAPPMPFLLAFVTTTQRVAEIAALIAASAQHDEVVWLAYPKRTSRRYSSELNRDAGWESLRAAGFDTVRQIAIDEDWSALRFRRTRYIGH